jgi:acetyl esterase/lipase
VTSDLWKKGSAMKKFECPWLMVATTIITSPAAAQLQPTHANLTYATLGPTPLQLDLYLPSNAPQPYPLVVWIHGGAWSGGDKFPAGNAGILNQHGFAVASINYRLTSQAGQYGSNPVIFPAQIHDVKGAIRWLRANADIYNLDIDHFGAWGSSAGGHLAALAGTSSGVAAIEGAIGGNLSFTSAIQSIGDFFGPTDLLNMQLDVTNPPGSTIDHDAPGSPESHLIGFDQPGQGIGVLRANQFNPNPPYPALIELITQANPITWVDASGGDPPFYIAHGTLDTVVPQGQSTKLANALTDAGVPHVYFPVVGGGHGTNFPPTVVHATVAHFMHTLRHAPGDVTDDGAVNIDDLLMVLNGWGQCAPPPAFCPAEATGDQTVNINDLLMVINAWS